MNNSDLTLTSPLSVAAARGAPLLTLTIVWHPDLSRVGEQYFDSGGGRGIEVSRFAPLFAGGGRDGAPLLYGGVSRQSLQLVRTAEDAVELRLPDSRMVVELDGEQIRQAQRLDRQRIAGGVMLGLGRAVLLCLHWSTCLPRDNPVPGLLGVSSAAVQSRTLIRAAAAAATPVLLLGETGTGKEVAARAIHMLGPRPHAPLVAVNMATLNESLAAVELFGAAKGAYTGAQAARSGLFAEADGGTLFLDEIGDTPAAVQPMLLRVLESCHYRPVGAHSDIRANIRLIAATDRDLDGAAFNQPLLRRLEQLVITLAPLRTRREDIGVLIAHFLQQACRDGGAEVALPFGLVTACATYHWPGNIRQLMHVLGRARLALQLGDAPDLPTLTRDRQAIPAPAGVSGVSPDLPSQGPLPDPAARRPPQGLSEQDVLRALDDCGWQIQGAARALGISRPSLYKLMDSHSAIRKPEQIAAEDLRAALAACGGVVEQCATRLRTPAEALRRHLRACGIGG